MQIKVSKKNIWICLLLCSLFLTSYISVLSTNGIVSSYAFNSSSLNGGSEQSSMNSGSNLGSVAYIAADTSGEFLIFSSMRPSRLLVTKTNLNILTAIVAAQIIISSSRLSDKISSQFNSIKITFFLHKKDGMK